MKPTSEELKNLFLERINDLDYRDNLNRQIRRTRERLWKEFDEVWVKYNNNQATFAEWNKALDKWLNSEVI